MIDTFKSQVKYSPKSSVIQGSKLSAMLYTIYVNEVPQIHKLMSNIKYDLVTGDKFLTNMTKLTIIL